MKRNVLYIIIGAFAFLSAVLGYQYYQERHKTMEIDIGKGGISIQKN